MTTGPADEGGRRAARPSPGRRSARLPDRMLWIDGELCRGRDAVLTLFDRGARDGEGLFETLAVHGGEPLLWERHMERLVLAAAELGFPVPPSPATLRHGLDRVLEANRLGDAAVRVTVTRGVPGGRPTRAGAWIEAEPLAARLWAGTRSGAARAIVSARPFEPGPLGPYKTTSRLAWQLAREEARAAHADEAVLVSPAGEVLEGSVSNVFAVLGDEVRTPPLSRGILPGITRAVTLRLCQTLGIAAREARLDLAELESADEAFLTSSLQGIVPLATLRGLPLPARAIGSRLRDAYRREVERVGE